MESKSLIFGIIGFILGGLIVSIAATTTSQDQADSQTSQHGSHTSMSSTALSDLSGDAFDKQFLADMILHHQGALDMAELAKTRAKHDEIKRFSLEVISAQSQEIQTLKTFQQQWGYKTGE